MPEPGIIYLNRPPPFMKPQKIKHIFSAHGELGRVFMQPEDEKFRKRRVKEGGSKKIRYLEGWVEFKDKRVAKAVAATLNTTQIGGKKRSMYYDDLWNIKYLSKFRWSDLSAKIGYRKATAQKQAYVEISQAKRENEVYVQSRDKGKALAAIIGRKLKRKREEADEGHEEGHRVCADKDTPSLAEAAAAASAWTYKQPAAAPKRRKSNIYKVLGGDD
ncbi:uncharacterized protein LOC135815980 [Sycon ciliatum]|uniref:uncharacterized protein LOC135815980 n=1 Tax=Sycon ciliatum TaxID=27933 RepID=UPI0031F689BA